MGYVHSIFVTQRQQQMTSTCYNVRVFIKCLSGSAKGWIAFCLWQRRVTIGMDLEGWWRSITIDTIDTSY